ncbi:MAG: hypothetical protein NXY57DRAFT_1072908 [Lentinula lateritia]|nr:MAG: hypothetical protein NXY57DRAFT_1072908 [Lentinula lateritia]
MTSSHPLRDAAIPHTVLIANASKAAVGTVGSISVAHKGQTNGVGPGLVSQSGNNPTGSANADEVSSEDVNCSNVDEINENSSGLSSAPDSEDDGQGPWTTVQSRRSSKSLDNLKTQKDFFKPDKLTKEQKATVKVAEQRMTPAQREIINNQNLAIQKQQQAHSYSKPQDVGIIDSLLARMIRTKKRSKKSIKNHESSSDSDADSESSDSESCSESTSSNGSSSSSSEELDSSDDQKRGGRKSKKRTYNRIIKPVPPSIWNGEADAEVFQRIVLEGYQFCKEGKIPKNERVFLISHYLSGKAYQFFALKVAKNHSKWSLQEFYEGLFNYCFPVNHCEQMRTKLRKCYQNGRTVSEYVHELESIIDHVGIMSQHEKVLKLWDGLSPSMRYELKRARVSKEVHSWRHIVREAELIELAGFEKDSSPRFAPKQSDRPRDDGIYFNKWDKNGHFQQHYHNSSTREKSEPIRTAPQSTPAPPSSSTPRNPARSDNSVHRNKNDYQSSRGRPQTNHDRTSRTTRKPDSDGNCYKCGQAGHFARNCPSNNIVHSRNNGPPGISAQGMQFPLHNESSEMLAQLVETTEQPGVLTLNMMHFTSFVDDVSEDSAFKYMSENNNSLTPISNADSVLEDGLLPLPLPDLESVSDSDIEADNIPDLQDVSDSEYDDDDMFDSSSTFEIDLLESDLWPQCSDSDPEGEGHIENSNYEWE